MRLTAASARGYVGRVSVLILNAGLAGREGNSHVIAEHAAALLQGRSVPHELMVLKDALPGEVASALGASSTITCARKRSIN